MKLAGKKILIVSPEPWSHVFVSKHHYAIELCKRDNEVYFLNPPSSSLRVDDTPYSGVFNVQYKGFVRGLRRLPKFLRQFFVRRTFGQLEKYLNVQFDVIWSFDNSVFFDFDVLPSRMLKISHIVDLNQDFETARAAGSADICFVTTDMLRLKLSQYNANTFFINHGFAHQRKTAVSEGRVLPGKNALKAVYIGNLAMRYLDWHIMLEVARTLDQVDFVLFGPDFDNELNNSNDSKSELRHLPNVYFEGKIPSESIPEAIDKADILYLFYQQRHHDDQANPHKMMEYLSSGKVIVATRTIEYELLSDLVCMSKDNSDWVPLFSKVVGEIDTHANAEKVKQRKAYALDNTYTRQLDRIEQYLQEVVVENGGR